MLAAIVLLAPPSAADAQSTPGPPATDELLDFHRKLAEQAKQLDWNQEYPAIQRQMENMWRKNGWGDESDRFALQLVQEVAAIPPWQVMERIDLISRRAAERYGMSAQQAARLRWSVVREAGGFVVRNAGTILKHTQEFLDGQLQGRPFTAEQVAKWVREGQPLLKEMNESVDRMINELKAALPPDRREILERDVGSYEKRRRYLDDATERWARGEWNPSEWGWEDLPQYQPKEKVPAAPPPSIPPAAFVEEARMGKIPGRWVVYDPSTWFVYVLDFSRRFELDPGQFIAARSVHDELLDRARGYVKSHGPELTQVPVAERMTHEVFEPIRMLFNELQNRLEAIPTTAQRSAGRENK